jgi:transcriptional regulator with XRE-family HTH domain
VASLTFEGFLKRIGANIQKARWIAGMTQQDVAARGMTYRWYQELERGERNASLRTMFSLARILKVPVSALVDTGEAYERLAEREAKPPKRGRKPSAKPKRRPTRT